MYTIRYTNKFDKSVKRDIKRGLDINLLFKVTDTLAKGIPLAEKHCDHQLTGNYRGFRECHIKPDWLLLYYIDGDTIVFYKTGTHADLFG